LAFPAPLLQGEGQVLAHQGPVLTRRPPGNTPVHNRYDLFTVTPPPPADGLQDDAAEGRQPVDGRLPGMLIQEVELKPQLAEKGVLAAQRNDAQDR
jgi:hypothetical protein